MSRLFKSNRFWGLIMAGLLIFAFHGQAMAKEGVLHKFARALFAIPKAVLNSMEGPSFGQDIEDGQRIDIHFPYQTNANYGQNLGYVSPVAPVIPPPPNYVTYKVIVPQKATIELKDNANVHIYSSIPFENR